MSRFFSLCFLSFVMVVCSNHAWGTLNAADTKIVFAPFRHFDDVPQVQVANADGSNLQSILPSERSPRILSLTVDHRDQTIYYGGGAANYGISRIGANGTGNTTLYSLRSLDHLVFNRSNATPSPYGLSLDTKHDKLYWTGGQNNSNGFAPDIPTFIQRANLDGSDVEIVRQTLWSESSPYRLVVDGQSEKMYWTDMSDDSIRSANLDGSGMETVLNRGMPLGGLAVDFQNGVMFWSEPTSDLKNTNIMSAGLDGTEVNAILTVSGDRLSWFRMPTVVGMDVDPAARQLYFTHWDPFLGPSTISPLGTLFKTKYDGSDVQIIISDVDSPFNIGLLRVPEPSCMVLASVVCCVWASRRGLPKLAYDLDCIIQHKAH